MENTRHTDCIHYYDYVLSTIVVFELNKTRHANCYFYRQLCSVEMTALVKAWCITLVYLKAGTLAKSKTATHLVCYSALFITKRNLMGELL